MRQPPNLVNHHFLKWSVGKSRRSGTSSLVLPRLATGQLRARDSGSTRIAPSIVAFTDEALGCAADFWGSQAASVHGGGDVEILYIFQTSERARSCGRYKIRALLIRICLTCARAPPPSASSELKKVGEKRQWHS
jgi:hypothetical protein